jgi:hypothetical protein
LSSYGTPFGFEGDLICRKNNYAQGKDQIKSLPHTFNLQMQQGTAFFMPSIIINNPHLVLKCFYGLLDVCVSQEMFCYLFQSSTIFCCRLVLIDYMLWVPMDKLEDQRMSIIKNLRQGRHVFSDLIFGNRINREKESGFFEYES